MNCKCVPSSFCTISTFNCHHELYGLLLSLSIHHPSANIICVVEDIRDVMAIESTGQFKGLYHVLGGKIAPIEGIGPQQLTIDALITRVEQENIDEIIFALSSTMEGDTTNYYIFKKLSAFELRFSAISRGIGIGDELEYADELTLGRSISQRIPFEISMKS